MANCYYVKLVFHHGGKLAGGNRYVGGKVKVAEDLFDMDLLSYPNLLSYVKQDLGYTRINGLYHMCRISNNFTLLSDDASVMQVGRKLQNGDKFELYIDHFEEIESTSGNTSNDKQNQPFVQVGLGSQNSAVPQDGYNQFMKEVRGCEDKRPSSRSKEHEVDDQPHLTFDEFHVPVEYLTDNEDDELQEARQKVKNFWTRNSTNVVSNDIGEHVMTQEEELVDDEDELGGDFDSDSSNSSKYFDSDDLGSYYSESDDSCGDDAMRRPSTKIRYDASATIPVFCLGMVFENVNQFRYAVSKYAVMKGLGVKFVKNEAERVRAKCKTGCPWVLFASIEKIDGTFIIKRYEGRHRCTRVDKNRMANSNFLCTLFKTRIMTQPSIKIKDIKSLCRTEFKLQVSMTVCRNTKKKVINQIMGDYTEQFADLRDYVEEVKVSNPGSTCVVKSSNENGGSLNFFERFYVCFQACKQGWIEGCRPILGLDGCFLKGICKGQILCAIGRDGNNQMFPLAWAVVDVENKYNWSWFLRCLKFDLPLKEGEGFTIISDMQKVSIYIISNF